MVTSPCSSGGHLRVTLVTHPVISHEFKRDDFNFFIVNFPFIDSNIHAATVHPV